MESSVRIALLRARAWDRRLLPKGHRPGQDRIFLSLCSWFTLLQGRGARLYSMIHWAPLSMEFLTGMAPLSPLWHRRAAVQSRLWYPSACEKGLCTRLGHGSQNLPISVSWSCHLVPCSPRLGSLRSTFTYRQLLNLYSFTASGKRLPNRTPVTVYLWCLRFFAFLVQGFQLAWSPLCLKGRLWQHARPEQHQIPNVHCAITVCEDGTFDGLRRSARSAVCTSASRFSLVTCPNCVLTLWSVFACCGQDTVVQANFIADVEPKASYLWLP